jgi:uncharacterized protein (DUF305 family)
MASDDDIAKLRSLDGMAASQWFVELMINHHLGGIHMAEFAVAHASTNDVRRLAQGMIDGQNAEIAELRKWQQANPAV